MECGFFADLADNANFFDIAWFFYFKNALRIF